MGVQGSGLDSYAKQWRLFADCFNNVGANVSLGLALHSPVLPGKNWLLGPGYVLELLSPVFPHAFLFLACLGSIARAVTGMSRSTQFSQLHTKQPGEVRLLVEKRASVFSYRCSSWSN